MFGPLELERWRALALYDTEIRAVAETLSTYGDEWEFEFARAFFALNEDRRYIKNIYDRLLTEAKLTRELEIEREKIRKELELLAEFNVTSDGRETTTEALAILKKAVAAGYKISIDARKVIAVSAPGSAGESYLYNESDIRRFGRYAKI